MTLVAFIGRVDDQAVLEQARADAATVLIAATKVVNRRREAGIDEDGGARKLAARRTLEKAALAPEDSATRGVAVELAPGFNGPPETLAVLAEEILAPPVA